MRTRFTIAIAAALVVAFVAGRLSSQEGVPDPAELQRLQMEMMQPGDEHDLLADMEGEWESAATLWMPGAPEFSTRMTSTSSLILGDRFLQQWTKGSFMGQPVESLTILGFDRRHGVYTMVGFDTMGTYYITASGKRDPDTGTILFEGRDEDLGGEQVYTFEMAFNGDDEVVTTLTFSKLGAMPIPEGGFKMMQNVATRKNRDG